MYSAPSSRRRAGFSLAELLVGLVLSGILATIIFQLLRGQSRFVAVQSAREEVQQNVRGALDVIAADLRGVPPGALVQGTGSLVRFYSPRVWGTYCAGNDVTADILLPQLPAGSMPGALAGEWGLMGDTNPMTAGTGAGAWVPAWTFGQGAARSTVASWAAVALAASNCGGMSSAGPVQAIRLTGTNLPTGIPQGNPVFLFQQVQYDVGTGTDGRLWVRRGSGAAGAQQPLAGPLPADNSLRFQYYNNTNTAVPAVAPGTTAASLAAIDRVQVFLTTRSRSTTGGQATQAQADSVMVFLRNQ